MTYSVKEIFYSLQGEGAQVGRPTVFCRFAGCNLWSGREHDRATAICKFCDTEFVGTDGIGGGTFAGADTLAAEIARFWPAAARPSAKPLVIFTGGEPLLQLDAELVNAMHRYGFEVAIETNGTLEVPSNIDWVCVSPKANSNVVVKEGNELKLIFPQAEVEPTAFENWRFDHFFLQPMDGPDREENTQFTLQYCLENPQWRLSLQTHKFLNIR